MRRIEALLWGILLALAGSMLCWLGTGCSPLTPAQQAQYTRVKCEIAALEPLAMANADAAVRALEDGRVGLDDLIELTATAKTDVGAVRNAFATCRAAFPAPQPMPSLGDAGAP